MRVEKDVRISITDFSMCNFFSLWVSEKSTRQIRNVTITKNMIHFFFFNYIRVPLLCTEKYCSRAFVDLGTPPWKSFEQETLMQRSSRARRDVAVVAVSCTFIESYYILKYNIIIRYKCHKLFKHTASL